MYRLLLIAAAATPRRRRPTQPRMPAARAVDARRRARDGQPVGEEGFFSGEDGRQGQWGLGFQTPSYFGGSVFNVLTPTTILALSPVILLTVFLATVIFGVPLRCQSLIKSPGSRLAAR